VADVTHPLIGVDVLSHFGLLVDYRNNSLLDEVTSLSAQTKVSSSLFPSVNTITGGTPVESLLVEFPYLTRLAGVQCEVHQNTLHPSPRTLLGPPATDIGPTRYRQNRV
jgi:hypothetical protein